METLERMEVLSLISELRNALDDHHTGMNTIRPFAVTYARDRELLKKADGYISALVSKEGARCP